MNLPNFRSRPRRSEAHLAFLRKLPCCACPTNPGGQAHHPKVRDPDVPESGARLGSRSDDFHAVPICRLCHQDGRYALHAAGESIFWERLNRGSPYRLAAALEQISGNEDAGRFIVRQFIAGRFR